MAEASPKDCIWGIGYAEDHPCARDRSKWTGKNQLGRILTEVRDELMEEFPSEHDECKSAKHAKVDGSDALDIARQKYPKKYTFFWQKSPFSQWQMSQFTVGGVTYNCAEQYMMHQKAGILNEP